MKDYVITTHPRTGLPVRDVPQLKVGDLVSECIGADSYPAVVVDATRATVYVQPLSLGFDYLISVHENDIPGVNGYGDTATLVFDPEAVERAVARGRKTSRKYVRHVFIHPDTSGSFAEREEIGSEFHRASYRTPNGGSFKLAIGARHRSDPHI